MPANVVVPEVGESIVDARVAKWLKKEGDPVNVGDPLVEIETDKIDLEVAAPQGGVLSKIAHGDGADVKVGEVLGVIEEGNAAGPGQSGTPSGAAPAEAVPAAKAGVSGPEAGGGKPEGGSGKLPADKTRATPAARNAAQKHAVNLTSVQGTGDAGRVMRRDVESAAAPQGASADKAAAAPNAAPADRGAAFKPRPVAIPAPVVRPAGERTEERVRMSKRRATIARRLVEAQSTAAMLTTFNEVDMSAVMALRERQKETFKDRHGVGLGLTSFFVKAAVGALREFPRVNAEIQGDEMVLKHYFDIGVAVGASEGLVVPVLRDADTLSFAQIE